VDRKEYMRQWRKNNPDKTREYSRRWNQSAAGKTANKKYRSSGKGKTANKKYRSSGKGKHTTSAYRIRTGNMPDYEKMIFGTVHCCTACGRDTRNRSRLCAACGDELTPEGNEE
jgi:hypothetical protein